MSQTPARGYVTVDLDKPRHLRYSMAAMQALKQQGIKLARIEACIVDADGEPNYENIAALLAAGLQHEDTAVTPAWVLENVTMPEMIGVLPKLREALGAAVGNVPEETKPAPPEVTGAKKK